MQEIKQDVVLVTNLTDVYAEALRRGFDERDIPFEIFKEFTRPQDSILAQESKSYLHEQGVTVIERVEKIHGLPFNSLCNLLDSAYSYCDYWIDDMRYVLPDGLDKDFFDDIGQEHSNVWHLAPILRLWPCYTPTNRLGVVLQVDGKEIFVSHWQISLAIIMLFAGWKEYYDQILNGDDDAETGDVLLQLACFQEVVYG